jgi:hypothetical protein
MFDQLRYHQLSSLSTFAVYLDPGIVFMHVFAFPSELKFIGERSTSLSYPQMNYGSAVERTLLVS